MRLAVLLFVVTMSTTATAAPSSWLWKKTGLYVNALAVAPDGSVAVYMGEEIVVIGPNGKERVKDGSFASPNATVQGLAFAPDGDLVVAGNVRRSLLLGGKQIETTGGTQEGIVVRYAADGKIRWSAMIRAGSSDSVYLYSVAVSKDRVLAVGMARRNYKADESTEGGLVVLLDAKDGTQKMRKVLDPGNEHKLRDACATGTGFVATGDLRPHGGESTIVHGLGADGTAKWSHIIEHSLGELVACLGDRAFATSLAEDRISVLEFDAAGKVEQTIVADTKGRTEALSISANPSEIAITTRSEVDNVVASRLSRYRRDGKLIGTDEYATTAGPGPIWILAAYGPKGLVLGGEVERQAKVTIRGHELSGPTLFVVGP